MAVTQEHYRLRRRLPCQLLMRGRVEELLTWLGPGLGLGSGLALTLTLTLIEEVLTVSVVGVASVVRVVHPQLDLLRDEAEERRVE